mmetsp:Transcript_32039/g.89693  ORF Transcript_32039/g.89693 Transcript_32039/m.89693 type:complete len:523 (-) Transcript_32039:2532-4100(-)
MSAGRAEVLVPLCTISSKYALIRSWLLSIKLFTSSMYASLFPNITPFARFCSAFATSTSDRRDLTDGGSLTSRNPSGEIMAGQKKRRKRKPPIAEWRDCGKRWFTSLYRCWQILRNGTGALDADVTIQSTKLLHAKRSFFIFSFLSSPAVTLRGSTSMESSRLVMWLMGVCSVPIRYSCPIFLEYAVITLHAIELLRKRVPAEVASRTSLVMRKKMRRSVSLWNSNTATKAEATSSNSVTSTISHSDAATSSFSAKRISSRGPCGLSSPTYSSPRSKSSSTSSSTASSISQSSTKSCTGFLWLCWYTTKPMHTRHTRQHSAPMPYAMIRRQISPYHDGSSPTPWRTSTACVIFSDSSSPSVKNRVNLLTEKPSKGVSGSYPAARITRFSGSVTGVLQQNGIGSPRTFWVGTVRAIGPPRPSGPDTARTSSRMSGALYWNSLLGSSTPISTTACRTWGSTSGQSSAASTSYPPRNMSRSVWSSAPRLGSSVVSGASLMHLTVMVTVAGTELSFSSKKTNSKES